MKEAGWLTWGRSKMEQRIAGEWPGRQKGLAARPGFLLNMDLKERGLIGVDTWEGRRPLVKWLGEVCLWWRPLTILRRFLDV